jgi:hypothetical protein
MQTTQVPFRLRSPCFTATRHASRQCDLPVPRFQIAAPSLCMELLVVGSPESSIVAVVEVG